MLAPHQPLRHEEQIGVKLPDNTHYIATVLTGALDTDEDILKRISTKVGTVFNVTGVKYEVVSSDPFRLKKLHEPRGKTFEEPVPDSGKRSTGPAIGETWRPKDPRRKAPFTVRAIEGDHVVTDDGRKIQLARFHRYERVV